MCELFVFGLHLAAEQAYGVAILVALAKASNKVADVASAALGLLQRSGMHGALMVTHLRHFFPCSLQTVSVRTLLPSWTLPSKWCLSHWGALDEVRACPCARASVFLEVIKVSCASWACADTAFGRFQTPVGSVRCVLPVADPSGEVASVGAAVLGHHVFVLSGSGKHITRAALTGTSPSLTVEVGLNCACAFA